MLSLSELMKYTGETYEVQPRVSRRKIGKSHWITASHGKKSITVRVKPDAAEIDIQLAETSLLALLNISLDIFSDL